MRGMWLLLTLAVATPTKNEVSVQATYPLPNQGIAFAYQRAVARRVSLQASLEHIVRARGYLHLPGFEAAWGVGLWWREAGRGVFVQPSIATGHNTFHRVPEQARHVFRLGADLGGRLPLGDRLSLGLAVGAQHGWRMGGASSICSYDYQCVASRTGVLLRARLSVGVRW